MEQLIGLVTVSQLRELIDEMDNNQLIYVNAFKISTGISKSGKKVSKKRCKKFVEAAEKIFAQYNEPVLKVDLMKENYNVFVGYGGDIMKTMFIPHGKVS